MATRPLAGDPRFTDLVGVSGFGPDPSPAPTDGSASSPEPSDGTGGASGIGDGLQVVEPLPSQDLLDAIVGSVAGTFFGH